MKNVQSEPVYRKTRFCMDSLPGLYEGYASGETWNGWACPLFDYNTAEEVLRASSQNGFNWRFDSSGDRFIVTNENDSGDYEPEEFVGLELMIEDERVHLYPIGARSWIWEECEE